VGTIVPGLNDAEIARLAAAGRTEFVERGKVVPLDGPTAAIVVDGCWRVFRNAAFARDVTLFLAKRGDVLAPGTLFGQRGGESGAQALGAASIVLVAAETFARVAGEEATLYLSLARNVAHRTAQVQAKLERFSRAPAEACVAAALLELCDDFGIPVDGGHRLELPLSQADLARLAGTTRETTSTAIAAFARNGTIRGSRLRDLTIVDAPALARAAEAFV
jgi:CRP/FNR family cyclic AMP-dependent transcriptional regulator